MQAMSFWEYLSSEFKMVFTSEFWSRKEISYQFVHAFIALMVAKVVFQYMVPSMFFGILIGTCVGVCLELYQFIIGGEGWKLADRTRDIFFWFLGSVCYFL